MKKNKVPKCDIITVTGHSTEAGLDAYDSGDEEQQQGISRAIDNFPKVKDVSTPTAPPSLFSNNSLSMYQTNNQNLVPNHPKHFIRMSPDDPRIKNPCFNFFRPSHDHAVLPGFQFFNCTVNIHTNTNTNTENIGRSIVVKNWCI